MDFQRMRFVAEGKTECICELVPCERWMCYKMSSTGLVMAGPSAQVMTSLP
jgi:hypothetical protein